MTHTRTSISLRGVWVGIAVGVGLTAAAFELPYVNWRAAAAPIDERPMMIRHDAKGSGTFLASRSGRRRHRGIDLVAPLNSPVRAIRSGRVIQVGTHRGLGRYVELEHRHQLRSVYAHLSEVRVEPGARVRQGDIIGLVGKTGNARHRWITPHLHLEVVRANEPIDPQTLGLSVTDPSVVTTAHEQPAGAGEEPFDAHGGE